MFLTKLKLMTVWLVIAGVLGLGGAVLTQQVLADKPVNAQGKNTGGKKAETGSSFSATIQAVDPAKQTVRVTVGDKTNREDKTLPLAKDVKVLLREGKDKNEPATEGKLADLSAGMSASFQLSADGKTVTAITPAPLRLSGSVTAVDANRKTITIRTKDKSGPDEQSFRLADDARVLLNDGLKKNDLDTEGKLTDLEERAHVQLHVSLLDRSKVLAVRVQGGSLHGAVAGLDLGTNTLTLTVKEDGQKVDKIITLLKDARVDSTLMVGDMANVRLSVFDKSKAVAVHKMKSKDGQEE